jgi:hypothetical protein
MEVVGNIGDPSTFTLSKSALNLVFVRKAVQLTESSPDAPFVLDGILHEQTNQNKNESNPQENPEQKRRQVKMHKDSPIQYSLLMPGNIDVACE